MVCQRCIDTVKQELRDIGLEPDAVFLGEVAFTASTSLTDIDVIEERLKPAGFSLLRDKKTQWVTHIKRMVEEVYNGDFDFPYNFRFSALVAEKLNGDYDILSQAFSTAEGKTLEKYIIEYRIEKVKELLVYSTQTLADISFRLGFSSVAHLSRQFKEVTGINASHFIALRKQREHENG